MIFFDGAPFDRVLCLDFETAWDSKEYTLSKMTTEEYIRDPRFHAWGLCWQEFGEGKPVWVAHDDIPAWVASVDWSRTAVLAHNALFDVSILSWVYGAKPAFIFDSLSMAQALRGVEVGNSLAKLADTFGLPPKGRAVHSTDGMFGTLPAVVERELAEYCAHDVYLCSEVFSRLLMRVDDTGTPRGMYPIKELRLIDMTLKMYTQPHLELDGEMLEQALEEERTKREAVLGRLESMGLTESDLASNPKFAQALQMLGVEAPTKISKTTGQPTLALAKNDALFQALLNGDREDVALLCEARLKVKSTLERTRAQRFLDISKRGRLPVPLSYYGALTGRWTASKGSNLNMQNLKRGSFLRNAIMAPEGSVVVVGDLAQIEPRVLAWLAGYDELLELFRSGVDVYAAFGAQMFGIPGLSRETHSLLRQSSKAALIGAGYGLGWAAFSAQVLTGFLGAPPMRYDKDAAKQFGVTSEDVERFISWDQNLQRMGEIPHTCSTKDLVVHCLAAKAIIDKYRAAASPVVDLWGLCQQLIGESLYGGKEREFRGMTFRKEEIVLPNGMSLRYPVLKIKQHDAKGRPEWVYGPDGKKLYGGKVVENITQALARIVMTDGMLRVQKRYFVAGTVHDELLAIAPESESEEAVAWVKAQMVKTPSWMPGVPLDAGVGADRRYGLAKD